MDLQAFFAKNPDVALGFSGGVDSSYLLYAAKRYGARVRPYFIKTAFQPLFELRDARRMAGRVGVDMAVLNLSVLDVVEVAANPTDRCYHCKRALFAALRAQAASDGFSVLIDGTNASDDAADRAGTRALRELSVYSPLRDCGITKEQVRALSREAGLFTWNKPAYACLATRIPTGEPITEEMLTRVEGAEDALFAMGFADFRVRVFHGAARLQLVADQMPAAIEKRREIQSAIAPFFAQTLLDLRDRA